MASSQPRAVSTGLLLPWNWLRASWVRAAATSSSAETNRSSESANDARSISSNRSSASVTLPKRWFSESWTSPPRRVDSTTHRQAAFDKAIEAVDLTSVKERRGRCVDRSEPAVCWASSQCPPDDRSFGMTGRRRAPRLDLDVIRQQRRKHPQLRPEVLSARNTTTVPFVSGRTWAAPLHGPKRDRVRGP